MTRHRYCLYSAAIALIALVGLAGCGGDDDPVGSEQPPDITQFTVSTATVSYGDSVLVTWKSARADSLKLTPGNVKLLPVDSGSHYVRPVTTTTYVLRAYNAKGTDSASAAVTVTIVSPVIQALNGTVYKGEMGSTAVDPVLEFRVTDSGGAPDPSEWVYSEVVEGDGSLSPDSVESDASGLVSFNYMFSGTLGYSTIRAFGANTDTVAVRIRASTIAPGLNGQGQYVVFGDTYADVKAFNGTPASVDEDPSAWLMYAVYEAALGVVVVIDDANHTATAEDDESVYGVIMNGNGAGGEYSGKTSDSLGVGSTIQAFRDVYGTEDSTYVDTVAPAADVYRFYDENMTLFTLQGQDEVFEIHIYDPSYGSKSPAAGKRADDRTSCRATPFRRWTY